MCRAWAEVPCEVKAGGAKGPSVSDCRGKVVLPHFWGTNSTCLPRLKKWYDGMKEYHEQFVMISLSLDDLVTPVRRLPRAWTRRPLNNGTRLRLRDADGGVAAGGCEVLARCL